MFFWNHVLFVSEVIDYARRRELSCLNFHSGRHAFITPSVPARGVGEACKNGMLGMGEREIFLGSVFERKPVLGVALVLASEMKGLFCRCYAGKLPFRASHGVFFFFTFFYIHKKKVLDSRKFSTTGFRWIDMFWDVLNTIGPFLEKVCLSTILWTLYL